MLLYSNLIILYFIIEYPIFKRIFQVGWFHRYILIILITGKAQRWKVFFSIIKCIYYWS